MSAVKFPAKIIVLIATLLMAIETLGQVEGVQRESRENQRSRKSKNETSGNGDFLIDFFLYVTFEGLAEAQHSQLMRREEEPWLVSLEGLLSEGYYFKNNNLLFLPSVRVNWGLFSTSLRYDRMQDNSGLFKTLDWQIVILNIVNKPHAAFRVGTGISNDYEVKDLYNEHFFGLDLHFNRRKVNPTLEFRISKDYDNRSTPRTEWNTRVDFQLMNIGKLDVNLMTGFLYQKYFSSVNFYFIQTGINLVFY